MKFNLNAANLYRERLFREELNENLSMGTSSENFSYKFIGQF